MTVKTMLSCIASAMLFFVSAASAAKVGEQAPGFTLMDVDGNERSLSEYQGEVVVLEWTNHGCPFVKKYYKSENMQRLQSEMREKGAVWLSICSSPPGTQGHMSRSEWQKALNEYEAQATATLIDDAGEAGRKYRAITTPHMFVIDRDGTLVYNGAIDSRPTTSVADIAKADPYVKMAVEATLEGKPVGTPVTKPYGCNVKYADS